MNQIKVWKCVKCRKPCVINDKPPTSKGYCVHAIWEQTQIREDDYIEDDVTETKYYKMEACFEACGDDDRPFNEDLNFNVDKKYTLKDIKENCKISFSYIEITSGKWQIKRAEPKVLTNIDIENLIVNDSGYDNSCGYLSIPLDQIEFLIEKIDKNGQLKQWLNHKELREAVNYLAEDWTCTNDSRIKIENALKNLKQLNEDNQD